MIALGSTAAALDRHLALVIGNGAYRHTSPLKSPQRDAEAMAATLQALGYEVETLLDADRRALAEGIEAFGRRAEGADSVLVYYSGHGMELRGENYLIPVDARRAAPHESVPIAYALEAVAGARRLSVIVLDACRTNTLDGVEKSGAKGFLPVQAKRGQLIAYSTAPGTVAYDGGANALSPYTRALTETLAADPTADVRVLFTSLADLTSEYAVEPQSPFTRIGGFPRGLVPISTRIAAAPPRVDAAPSPPSLPGRPAGGDCDGTMAQPISCLGRLAK